MPDESGMNIDKCRSISVIPTTLALIGCRDGHWRIHVDFVPRRELPRMSPSEIAPSRTVRLTREQSAGG